MGHPACQRSGATDLRNTRLKTPSTKIQTPEKLQISSSKSRRSREEMGIGTLGFIWSLVFGVWCFHLGVWSLVFDVSLEGFGVSFSRPSPIAYRLSPLCFLFSGCVRPGVMLLSAQRGNSPFEMNDVELLREYVGRGCQDSFAELVRRHVNLVYGTATRQVRDPHLAQEISQKVFCALAQNARSIRNPAALTAWLYLFCEARCNLLGNGAVPPLRSPCRYGSAPSDGRCSPSGG